MAGSAQRTVRGARADRRRGGRRLRVRRRRRQGAADTLGKTTVEQRIVPRPGAGFRTLRLGAGRALRRPPAGGRRRAGRAAPSAARSLLYFGQLSDFQLADEESPARVEFIDYGSPVRRRLAPLGGDGAPDRRRDDPPAQRVRGGEPGRRRATAAPARWTSRSTPATRPTASSSTRPSGCGPCSRAARSNPDSGIDPATSTTRSAPRRRR